MQMICPGDHMVTEEMIMAHRGNESGSITGPEMRPAKRLEVAEVLKAICDRLDEGRRADDVHLCTFTD